MSDIPSQLSQIFHTRPLSIALMEIDHQQEIGDQSREQLHQEAMRVSGDLSACNAQAGEMIDFEVLFPPGEEGFNLPSKRENEGDLSCGEVLSVGSDPVCFASTFEAHQVDWIGHPVHGITQ